MLNDDNERALVHIEQIKEISPIEGADRIEVAKILGWNVVVKKGEFRPGDQCVYFEIDSILPKKPWCEFLVNPDKPDKPIRLKTKKMKGVVSQGLALPIPSVFGYGTDFSNGTDVTQQLEVVKYEPYIPAQLAGIIVGQRPFFVPKTDEERIQNIPDIIQEVAGISLYKTVKMDGTSSSYFYKPDIEVPFGVCSRNLQLKEDPNNTYWKMVFKYDILNKLKLLYESTGNSYVLQGEICGPGIQKNRMGLKEVSLFLFNVLDLNTSKFLNFYDFVQFCEKIQIPTVPVDGIVTFTGKETVEDLLVMADGLYDNGKPREGIVYRPVVETVSQVLKGGRLSFKTVSNKYLLAED